MVFRYNYRGGVWVDLENPTPEDIRAVAEEFSIPDHISRELLAPTPLPLSTRHDNLAYMVLHYPAPGGTSGDTTNQEVDFVVGRSFVVTVRYELVTPIRHVSKLLEAQQLVEGKALVTTDMLLEILFAHIFTAMRDHATLVAEKLSRAEREMFEGNERVTIHSISNQSRAFLHLESALANQEESMEHFFQTLVQLDLFTSTFPERVRRILAERVHVVRIVRTHRAAATELRETNIALLESRQNAIMKTLTIMTVAVLPLELIAFIFGMHLPGTPLENNPNAFILVMAGMFGITLCTALYFAWKRWLF